MSHDLFVQMSYSKYLMTWGLTALNEMGTHCTLRNRTCRKVSPVNTNFSVNQMCPIICRWKLVKHRHCFGDNKRTKDIRRIKLCMLCDFNQLQHFS